MTNFQIGYVVAAVTVLAPVATCIFVNRVSRKTLMLLSASLMAAATIFVALMVHFRADVQQAETQLKQYSHSFQIVIFIFF